MLLEVIDIRIICVIYFALQLTPREKNHCQKIQNTVKYECHYNVIYIYESFLNIRYDCIPFDTHYNSILGVGTAQLHQSYGNSAGIKLILVVELHGRRQCRKLQSMVPSLRQNQASY